MEHRGHNILKYNDIVSHPSTFTRAKLSIVANPLTGDSNFWPFSVSLTNGLQIIVPGAERLKIFLMTIGMSYRITGIMVRGCKTFAPKYDCWQVQTMLSETHLISRLIMYSKYQTRCIYHFPCLLIRQFLQDNSLTDCRRLKKRKRSAFYHAVQMKW